MKNPPVISPDVHSFAQPQVAVVTHLDLNLEVDFENKIIRGKAAYTLSLSPGAEEIILDTRDLNILKVETDSGEEAHYRLGPANPVLGQALIINIDSACKTITVYYQTKPIAAALQWLHPAQTGGKKYPFLFTQSQAILARTWLPCQDSPGIRFTYQAQVQVPPQFMALMSAENPTEKNNTGQYSFTQKRPIPSYLMALAVGDLIYTGLDERTGIYTEPEQQAAAAYEFAELPAMLKAAENLYEPYLWGRYDLLLLPPSFPFGGMENPELTFVTPTIIAQDRSLTSLVAHELAHSWSGNLVTNATWNDFWLNEGFTVYFERRIMEALYGKEYADMLKVLGLQDLEHTLQEIGPNSPDTQLKLNLLNRDPDEGLTEIAYEKGNYFLLALEEAYGREAFDEFIRQYFQNHAFQAMDTENFILYLQATLLNRPLLPNATPVEPETWIYRSGLPAARPVLTSKLFTQVASEAEHWRTTGTTHVNITQNWSTHEWLYFLNLIEPALTQDKIQALDEAFHFTQSGNAEILAVWFRLAVQQDYATAYPALEAFLMRVGRRKFLLPLYKGLLAKNQTWAKQIYQKARPNYHAVATSSLDVLLSY